MPNYFGAAGATDSWFTPAYIFEALGCRFDLDVCSPPRRTHVPCHRLLYYGGLTRDWDGFVWMNAPFGARNGLAPWLDKFFTHANGIALVPDRTSAPWFQTAAKRAELMLFIAPKVRFERPDGTVGKSPGDGSVLLARGGEGVSALYRARTLGFIALPLP